MTESALALTKTNTKTALKFATLAGVAIAAPLLTQQMISGPIVNAVLFTGTAMLGIEGGVLLAIFPSLIALSVGTLPAPLAPMIPFIMTGNILLVLIFAKLKNKYWASVITSSIVKFLFLFFSSQYIFHLIMKKEIAANLSKMMGVYQLATALAGGLIAFIVLSIINNKKSSR